MYKKHAPAVIVVGNYSLMNRVFGQLNRVYNSNNTEKPLRIGFDLSIANRTIDAEDNIDFMYTNLPKLPDNITGYIFPNMCIGYEGLWKAFQFLQK